MREWPEQPTSGPPTDITSGQAAFQDSPNEGAAPTDSTAGGDATIFIPPADHELARLRELLFGADMRRLEAALASLDHKERLTQRVSSVLPEAVSARSQDSGLEEALEPLVDGILKSSLQRRQGEFVNVLFPLMGPSIRKSIAETFRSMLENFSKSMEMAFSWRGLRWRFEALRTGRSFSETVLLKTLVYRVEQVFVIHSETGLVLSHLVNEGVGSQDADMVSAMLTAIQDFVNDCFAGGSEGQLDTLRLGEFTISIEKNPKVYIACVVRGTPPANFLSDLRNALDMILIEFGPQIDSFSGDTSPFEHLTRHLDPVMVTRLAERDKGIPLWAKVLPVVVVALLLGAGVLRYHEKSRNASILAEAISVLGGEPGIDLMYVNRSAIPWEVTALKDPLARPLEEVLRENGLDPSMFVFNTVSHPGYHPELEEALGALRSEPGIVLQYVDRSSRPWSITTLKDPLSREPLEVIAEKGINADAFTIRTVPHVSYDPSIVRRRVETGINLPPGVSMSLDDKGGVSFTGTASMGWMVRAYDVAKSMPGVETVDMSGVHDPNMEKITALVREVDATVVEFPLGRDQPAGAEMEKLKHAVELLVELEVLAKSMGFAASLTVYGHADATGPEKRNYEISQARTRTIAAMLYAKGSSMPIAMYGMGSEYPKGEEGEGRQSRDSQASRRVEFKVHLARSASAQGESIMEYILQSTPR